MSRFDSRKFLDDPSAEIHTIKSAKKSELIEVAKALGLDISLCKVKLDLKKVILEHYIASGTLGQEARQYCMPEGASITVEQQLEFEKIALEREKAKLAVQREQIAMEQEREKFEIYKAKLREEAEQHKAKLQLEADLAIKVEQERAKIQVETKEAEHELSETHFDLAKNIKLVPTFMEYDPEDYFRLFEETAKHLKWPEDQWIWLIKPKLTGKAAKVIRHLDNINSYHDVKKAILDSFAITEEGYRQNFRNLCKSFNQTFLEFASEKLRAFKRWLKSANVTTLDELINLMVVEEFKRKLPHNIMLHIEDRQEKNLLKAASIADSYFLIHKSSFKHNPGKRAEGFVKPGSERPPERSGDYAKRAFRNEFCSYCKKDGHNISNCPEPRCKFSDIFRSKFTSPSVKSPSASHKFKPVQTQAVTTTKPSNPETKPIAHVSKVGSADVFQDYIFDGHVSLKESEKKIPIKILRDTAGGVSLLHYSVLSGIEEQFTGDHVNVLDLTGLSSTPLAQVHLDCPIVKGSVNVGIRYKEFPVEGVHLLLGNDLAGKLVVPNLIICKSPPAMDLENENSQTVEEESIPVTVVTRGQSKKVEEKTVDRLVNHVMNRDELIKAQQADQSLTTLHETAVDKSEVVKSPCFYYDNGLLMRFYRPAKFSPLDTWSEKRQIVIPTSVRNNILEFAHDSSGGHLGISKTLYKISDKFFWPNLRESVKNYVKTCHVCQVVGNPNQVIPKAPLQPIIIPEEPFDKVIIDCVGPLPKTKGGNQYLLTLMCATTRYPEAIPLRNISAKTVAKAILKYFTSFGIPKEIQSDRGTNFTSDLLRNVLRELGIRQTLSSAYHPESQGALERWHQTFKTMLKKFCAESTLDWDEGINYLIFAIREAPQESLGFSPFEMVYGKQLRGPLALLTDEWLKSPGVEQTLTAEKYMEKLKNILSKVRQIAKENFKKAQDVMKGNFDKRHKVKARKFEMGDLVLAYFPIVGSPLQSKFHGPYKVVKNVNNNTYIIETPDRKKSTQLIHINLLKKYHSRPSAPGYRDSNNVTLNIVKTVLPDQSQDDINIANEETEPVINIDSLDNNSYILSNFRKVFSHLSSYQLRGLRDLLNSHLSLFSDQPKQCTLLQHDVELIPGTVPIRQHAYRMSPARKEALRAEVTYLLKNGFVEPSKSPWASPCLLVPKEDGSTRMCTDYRKVNSKTIKDSYPLPRLDDIIDSIGEARFVTKLDLMKGYYQIELTDRAKIISAFITPFGLFQYKVMPFGMTNAPSTFQRLINEIIRDLEGVYAYLDDIIIISNTWEEHLRRLSLLLDRLVKANLTINLKKSDFGKGTVCYLGHIVGSGHIRPKFANVEAILNYPVPETKKSLRRFLGMVSYYRKFCRNFSSVAAPLHELTSCKSSFVWDNACQTAFEQLKYFLTNDPILKSPNFNKAFSLQIDASDVGAGGVLLQESDGLVHPVSYTSSKFTKHQLSYSTIEKELLALVIAVKKFNYYIHGAPVTNVYTDHHPLRFLEQNKGNNQRLLRWSLFLQEYNLKIHHIKGSENYIADALSRVHTTTVGSKL